VLTTLLLTIGAAIPADGGLRTDEKAAQVEGHVLAELTKEQARRLEGREALYLVEINRPGITLAGRTIYDCVSSNDVNRTIWFPRNVTVARLVMVRATLQVIPHPGFFRLPDSMEYNLTRVRLVR